MRIKYTGKFRYDGLTPQKEYAVIEDFRDKNDCVVVKDDNGKPNPVHKSKFEIVERIGGKLI